jgi:hypothetical protein
MQEYINCKICNKPLAKKQITKGTIFCSRRCYYKSREGHIVSEETRVKIAVTKIGKPRPVEMVERVAAKIRENYATGKTIHWQTGVPRTEEMKQKQSKTMKRKYASGEIVHPLLGKPMPDHVRQILASHRVGSVASVETKLKMSESGIGGFWYGNIRYDDNPYCEKWTAELRERVRAYFNYICFECGTPQNRRKLNVHHIHYNKKTCCDGSPHDMVPLCPECHTKTNFNRDYWEDRLTELLYAGNPDGKCFFTKEEMAAFKAS